MAVNVQHAGAQLLGEGRGLEQLQEPEIGVRQLQGELVHGEIEQAWIDGGEVPVADVRDGPGAQAGGDRAHRPDGEVDLVRSDRDRRLVDLHVARSRLDQRRRLLVDDLSQRHRQRLARAVVLVERPVHHGVGTGQDRLDREVGVLEREAEPIDGHRPRPAHGPGHDRLPVVTVAVRAHQTRNAEPLDVLREVSRHVAAVHLAVHQEVEPQALLKSEAGGGLLPLNAPQLLGVQDAAREAGPRLFEAFRLRERSDGAEGQAQVSREEALLRRPRSSGWGVAHRNSLLARSRSAARIASLARAVSRGRNSRPWFVTRWTSRPGPPAGGRRTERIGRTRRS